MIYNPEKMFSFSRFNLILKLDQNNLTSLVKEFKKVSNIAKSQLYSKHLQVIKP